MTTSPTSPASWSDTVISHTSGLEMLGPKRRPASSERLLQTPRGSYSCETWAPTPHMLRPVHLHPTAAANDHRREGRPFRGGFELDAQVHNFPLGTFIYSCQDNSGPGGSEVVFCYDSAPYVSYLEWMFRTRRSLISRLTDDLR